MQAREEIDATAMVVVVKDHSGDDGSGVAEEHVLFAPESFGEDGIVIAAEVGQLAPN